MADTLELSWRDAAGALMAVGIIDVVPQGISTVYFFWDPSLRDLSIGTYSALYEIGLCRRWEKRYYYLGYLVAGSKTMSYKATFAGGELWDGTRWQPLGGRSLEDPTIMEQLKQAERTSVEADARHFHLLE